MRPFSSSDWGIFPVEGSVSIQWVEDLGRWEACESPDSSSDWRNAPLGFSLELPLGGMGWNRARRGDREG